MTHIMSEYHYELEEVILEQCGIKVRKYREDPSVLTKYILENKFDDILEYLHPKDNDDALFQVLGKLILQTGAKLPQFIKEKVIQTTKWDYDKKKYKWFHNVWKLRQFYLQDFQKRIFNHVEGKVSYLTDLKIHSENVLKKTLIGMEQVKSSLKLHNSNYIEYINLDGCNLIDFPKELFEFKSLSMLSLEHNQIRYIPESIETFKDLKKLYLNGNRLTSIPYNLGRLVNLEILDLSYNLLENMPKSFSNLKNLHTLRLNNNKLNKIPDIFETLNNLSIIDLRENPLKNLPNSIKLHYSRPRTYATKAFLCKIND